MRDDIKLILVVLPLGLDTFAVSAAIGLTGRSKRTRLRISVFMTLFEMTMPLIGLVIGRGLGGVVGASADWIAVAILIALGLYMLLVPENDYANPAASLGTGGGMAMVALGLSVSLDEFAIGFSAGLLRLSIWVAVILIGAQAFTFSQAGLWLGSRLGDATRESAQKLGGLGLVGFGLLLVVESAIR